MPNYLDEKFWEKTEKPKRRKGRKTSSRRSKTPKLVTRYDPETLAKVRISKDDPDYADTLTAAQMRTEKRRRAKEGESDFGARLGDSILKEAKGEAKKLWGSQRSRDRTRKEIKKIGETVAASGAVPKILKGVGLVGTVGGAVGAFATGAYYGSKHRKQAEEDYIKTQLGKYTWSSPAQFELVKEHIRSQYRSAQAAEARRRYTIK